MKKIFFAAEDNGDMFGWGICCRNLIRELRKLCEVHTLSMFDEPSRPRSIQFPDDYTVFMPIADNDLNPGHSFIAPNMLGYTFNEFPLGPNALANSLKYKTIFCGSTWCQERLNEHGITNTKVLIQGVDHSIFHPGPSRAPDGEFWIFSGGKFEYRKGQDLVLAGFKEILKTHPKAKLVTAWQNPWPEICNTMRESRHIKYELIDAPWDRQLGHLCQINGIPKEAVRTLPGLIPNEHMAHIYRQCDLGLFPNRCEGGTNLVMMEFMSCGKPVVANIGTGHKDVDNNGLIGLVHKNDSQHWAQTTVHDIASTVKYAIGQSSGLPITGLEANAFMRRFTWERAARTILENV